MKITVDGQEIIGKVKPITDVNKVKEVTEKFRSKYGDSDVKKYYTKFDVCVELALARTIICLRLILACIIIPKRLWLCYYSMLEDNSSLGLMESYQGFHFLYRSLNC